MKVYLSYGMDCNGDLVHVADTNTGKCSLVCPFCNCPLIAVRGAIKAAHFRHAGETCNESLNEISPIPAWHHFHLDYPLEVVSLLREGYKPNSKYPNVFWSGTAGLIQIPMVLREELLEEDLWSDNLLFTTTSRVMVGSLTLQGFSIWMREKLQERIRLLKDQVTNGIQHRVKLQVEAHRQQAILSATLYFFEYELEDGSVYHKVGRTRRSPEQRLAETAFNLETATKKRVIKSKILRTANNSGHVEKYFFHRYHNYLADIKPHTEYLILDRNCSKKVKTEFTRMANNLTPFCKEERFIVTGRWKYEEKRLAASKRGIELTIKEKGKFGRPKGSTLSDDAILEKHADIVSRLTSGDSINQAAEATSKGRSTVKRVKKVLYRKGQDY